MTGSKESTPPPPHAWAGKLFLCLIGLSVAAMGAVFVWLLGHSFLQARDMRTWPKVPCVILMAEMEQRQIDQNDAPEYRQKILFGYEWNGQPMTGNHISLRDNPWTSKPNVIEKKAAQYAPGLTTICYVDPAKPTIAVLKLDSLAPGYSIWFPLLFVIGGLGIVWKCLVPRKKS
ncbi:MAG: DUF3592 domain-containing protein [Verrucomicrobia bacterium]|nr:MAG: DUF3592 domain-containing protein [Verrucomicrobiota bacterium]